MGLVDVMRSGEEDACEIRVDARALPVHSRLSPRFLWRQEHHRSRFPDRRQRAPRSRIQLPMFGADEIVQPVPAQVRFA